MLSSHGIKAGVANYWRYERQYPVVAFEGNNKLEWGLGEQADILVVSEDGFLSVVEVKVSLADFRKDRKKDCHTHFTNDSGRYPVAYFYFAVPTDLATKVSYLCDDLYPYAGVIGCKSTSQFGVEVYKGTSQFAVEVYRKPKGLKAEKLTAEQMKYLTRTQTATLCRLATKVEELKQVQDKLESRLKEYKDTEKLTAGKA